jgi:hypothetical protein
MKKNEIRTDEETPLTTPVDASCYVFSRVLSSCQVTVHCMPIIDLINSSNFEQLQLK